MTETEYRTCINTNDRQMLNDTIDRICEYCIQAIKDRKLSLPKVQINKRMDSTSGKERLIGRESALQQCFDYIAVYSAMDIFERRMVTEQASSIPGRGQIYGIRMIRKWIHNDNYSVQYAIKHGLRYTGKCKYFVKLDIRKCYPSADKETFMDLFKRDCANEDIIWLWQELLKTHNAGNYTGLMIGALPSQWACQYMLSFIYRFAKSQCRIRRNQRSPTVTHMMMFMDDMLLFSGNRKALRKAVENITKYTCEGLHWTIKPNWHIRDINKFDVDMMGFAIRHDGSIRIRDRNFIHLRRLIIRGDRKPYTISQAKRLISYKGFLRYSNSELLDRKYSIRRHLAQATRIISNHDRRLKDGDRKSTLRRIQAERQIPA